MKIKLTKNVIKLGLAGKVLDVSDELGESLINRKVAEKTWSRLPKSKKKK